MPAQSPRKPSAEVTRTNMFVIMLGLNGDYHLEERGQVIPTRVEGAEWW